VILTKLALSLFDAGAQILHDNRGASAMLVAIALPGLIGFAALGAETGVWYTIKLQNQSAADAAALSAAYQVIAGKTNLNGDLTPAASEAAGQNGYKGTTPVVVYPYSDSIVSDGIAVSLQQTQGALLAAMFLPSVAIANRATALIEVLDNPCILALGTSGTVVEVSDLTRLDMPNCSGAANSASRSAIDLHGNTSSITAATLLTRGEISLQGNPIDPAAPPSEFTLASRPMIGSASISDPYAGTLAHDFLTTGMPTVGRCKSKSAGRARVYNGNCVIPGTSLTRADVLLSAKTQISGSWTVATGQTVDLSPGTYWVTGDLTIQTTGLLKCSTCDNVKGAGVTIILAEQNNKVGTLTTAANGTLDFNAPSSGLFAGLAIVQDSHGLPAGTTYTSIRSTLSLGPDATLNGLVYFPNSSMTFQGNPSAAGPKCLLLVVDALTVEGNSSLDTGGCTNAGLTKLPTVYTVALAQ
jgi:hypothetical protein